MNLKNSIFIFAHFPDILLNLEPINSLSKQPIKIVQLFASSAQEKTNDNDLLLVNLICNEINTNGKKTNFPTT
jgi:hypothetical protein